MQLKSLIILLSSASLIAACSQQSKKDTNNSTSAASQSKIVVDLGADAATLDPQMSEDSQSHRVVNDLFEGLTSYDQSNKIIPGLADKWEISENGKIYTFHLRPKIKFSDGTPITANDVVFTYQRLADPKVASPYNILINNLSNADDVMKGKKPLSALGIKALDKNTVQISLNHPDNSFLAIASLWNLGVVSQANVNKSTNWTDPKNMVTSGAYKLDEHVVKGYILESKNPYYYDATNVAINQIKFMPIEDNNSALSQYKSGDLDITYSLPVDQYKTIKTSSLGDQEHTVSLEGMYYYDFNMTSDKFKNNLKLRQALSMAVDRHLLVKDILGQNQVPLYSYATDTIDDGKYAGLDYEWSQWSREQQLATARELFKQSGYSEQHPLEIKISYNTNDMHKKIALAIASMWQQAFGDKSITVAASNQEWKTFLQARHKGDYDIARDAWIADYNSIDSYTNLYQCNNPQNNSHSCTPAFDKLLLQAQNMPNATQREDLTRKALQAAMQDYAIIPLYQYTYFRLIKPNVGGYTPETNHLDHVMSKWYNFNQKGIN